MPQFWKIDATQWINPTHIVRIEDDHRSYPPTIMIWMAGVEMSARGSAGQPHTVTLTGDARERLLTYLARDAVPGEP
jgi:hypothetical protein